MRHHFIAACISAWAIGAYAAPSFAATPVKVACIGEQTTHSDQLNRSVEYPAMLQTAVGAAYDVENFGDCCATVLNNYPKQAETHPYILGGGKPSYNESLTFAPDVVVVGSWGKHDTEIANSLFQGKIDPAQFQKDYEALLAAYQKLPSKPKIYLSTPVPIPKGAATGPTTDVILPAVRAAAQKFNLPIVDLYSVFLNHPELYKDDTHVSNVDGLQKIAQTVQAALQQSDAPVDAGAPDDAASIPDPAPDAAAPSEPVDASTPPSSHADAAAPASNDATPGDEAGGCNASGAASRASSASAMLGLVALGAFVGRRRRSR